MSLYFDTPVNFPDAGSISTNVAWHPSAPLLAVASYSQARGGFITIFDELGDPLPDITYPVHSVSQVTALAWHPIRNILVSGWENGDIRVWNGTDKEFSNVNGLHKAPVTLLAFSEKGGRLVSADSAGSLAGWKVDSKGQTATTFHHDLKETITHVTFRNTVKSTVHYDIEGLAKAAVNGDEAALDMFSNWRPRTTARQFRIQDGMDNQCFYVATQSGGISYINNSGTSFEVLHTQGVPLSYVLYHPSKDSLVIMLEGLTVGHFSVDSQGQLTELAKVKLSGRVQTGRANSMQGFVWAGISLLAILTGDLTVRLWDLETNDNYILPTALSSYSQDETNKQMNELFTCISYSKMNQTLCAGTNLGRIYFWTKKPNRHEYMDNPEDGWCLNNMNSVTGSVKQLSWGSIDMRLPLLAVNCVTKVFVMKEQTLSTCYSEKIWATQKTATQILLETDDTTLLLTVDVQVTDMSLNRNFIAFTNGRIVTVYGINYLATAAQKETHVGAAKKKDASKISVQAAGTFNCDNEKIIVYDKFVVTLHNKGVVVRTTAGVITTTITTVSSEGEPIGMDMTDCYLTVFTIEGYLKVYNLSNHGEPKLITAARNLYDMCSDFGEIIQAKCNNVGNKVALTLAASNLTPDGKLYVWDIEQDDFQHFDFAISVEAESEPQSGETYDEYSADRETAGGGSVNSSGVSADRADGGEGLTLNEKICANRIPLVVQWDGIDSRVLVCNAKRFKNGKTKRTFYRKRTDSAKKDLINCEQIIMTMFVSTEHGIRIQDIRAVDANSRLIAVSTPHIVILDNLVIHRKVMSDFNGLENCDTKTREAVLEFSYNLSLGNMDAAFKAIKLVQSVGVWNSLARMCVKTRRLDVAGVCLGHMGNARAAGALRRAVADTSLPHEAKLAVLAVQLGMLDEAEQLYISCNRYDLLNKLYQSRNKMDAALAIAESKDRIHLRNTEHMYGKILEEKGKFAEAAIRYERANTHRANVPRMLLDNPQELEMYVNKSNDPELLKWWAQYVESQGNLSQALKIYSDAGDTYSQVRVLCFLGQDAKAADLARQGNDKAAFYHMARHYETVGNIDDAVNFFTRANAYSNAVRLCRESQLSEELWNIGAVAGNREKIECAQYFEENEDTDKAIILYHRAGLLHRALDLAFKTQQFETLQQIATDLDANSDPALVEKCSQYFVDNQQYEKAVNLLAIGKKFKEALDICVRFNVQVTEDLSEKLTPEKGELDEEIRVAVLEQLAERLLDQGNYHNATKKFTQAGNKIRAMKSLLKSGDTDKIIFFAGVSRHRDIYIMAANYLQSLDWQNQPEVLRNIINFYSKGKALDLLANFYVACAQVEIDEFQNYEKALGALTEASRCLTKVQSPKDSSQHQRATDLVQQRMTNIKRFIDVRRLFERGDVQSGLTQCRQLLVTGGPDLEVSVRRGDIYATMIQYSVNDKNFTEAKQMVNELKQLLAASGNVQLTYYLSKELIEALAAGLGVPESAIVPPVAVNRTISEDTEDEVIEEVED